MSALDKAREEAEEAIKNLPCDMMIDTVNSHLENGDFPEALNRISKEAAFWAEAFDEDYCLVCCKAGKALQRLRELELMNYVPKSETK